MPDSNFIQTFLASPELIQKVLSYGLLILMRLLPILYLTPFLGGSGTSIPTITKISLGISLTAIVYPSVISHEANSLPVILWATLLIKEFFLGFTIGFLANQIFYIGEITGRALDLFRGAQNSELLIPGSSSHTSPLGQFGYLFMLVTFFSINGHIVFLGAIFDSFDIFPASNILVIEPHNANIFVDIVKYVSSLVYISFALVFPALFSAFFVDIVFGLLNKVAPQLNAYFMSLSIKSITVVFILLLSMPILQQVFTNQWNQTYQELQQLMDQFKQKKSKH